MKAFLLPLLIFGNNTKDNTEYNMTTQPFTTALTTPPVINPHSPAAGGYKQQPVYIPGVFDQTRNLFQPVVSEPPKDTK